MRKSQLPKEHLSKVLYAASFAGLEPREGGTSLQQSCGGTGNNTKQISVHYCALFIFLNSELSDSHFSLPPLSHKNMTKPAEDENPELQLHFFTI